MEQVLRTVAALNDTGFTGKVHIIGFRVYEFIKHNFNIEITMYETLLRPHEVAQVPQLQSIEKVSEKLKDAEKRREEKRLRQIANNKARLAATATTGAEPVSPTSGISAKRKRDNDNDELPSDESTLPDLDPGDAPPDTKRAKADEGGEGIEAEVDAVTASVQVDMIKAADVEGKLAVDESRMAITAFSSPVPSSRISVSNALPEVRGHTSYLTFAVLVPFPAPVDPSGREEAAPAPKPDASSAASLPEALDKSSTTMS